MTPSYKRKKLGDILVDENVITPEQLAYVIDKLKSTNDRFGTICLSEGLITEDALYMALA